MREARAEAYFGLETFKSGHGGDAGLAKSDIGFGFESGVGEECTINSSTRAVAFELKVSEGGRMEFAPFKCAG